ncbi:ComEC/Rec2 family competence protein [Acidicapsa dinghuensis]|uniref:ComEC/Rec2 family competence protein n=1 Tax=Acidicapsa dinghuensis TaxID=2218256 RepID=A0ABW1ELX1_9BACT|nr:MBL fold metallo-hydrolase [Acidicapsa dinghuensis]
MNRRKFLRSSGEVALVTAMPGLSSSIWADSSMPVLPQWSRGMLDLHHINTGRGNATLVVMPDGTSLLIDAGATSTRGPAVCPARPDESRRPGEWIARYVQRQLTATGHAKLDYALATHLHGDHVGDVTDSSPRSSYGDYRLTGISDVAEVIPITTLIDRGFPDYDFPTKVAAPTALNYIRFVQSVQQRETRVERARPGSVNQIIQLIQRHARQSDSQFEIRILSSSGAIRTGQGEENRILIPSGAIAPKDEIESENMLSIALRLRYGKFTYFTGADLNCLTNYGRDPWRDIETPVAQAAGPVDVATCNHHAYFDACGPAFVQALKPRVWILQSWHAAHASISSLANISSTSLYPEQRDVFCLGLHPAAGVVSGRFSDRFKSKQGHVLVRVAPGGEEYRVFVIDDGNEDANVTGAFGPYRSS